MEKKKNMIKQFSQKTKEELKYYVYALIDPRDGKIFYVGKGCGNRVFSHINEDFKETEKLETIRAIKKQKQEVTHYIIRHGLEEQEAFLVESVLIDFLTFKDFSEVSKIANIVSGHYSFYQGIKTAEDCEILYNCQELKTEDILHNILIININKTFDAGRSISKERHPLYERKNIYEAARGWWILDKNKVEKVDYVLAEYRGVVRAVFKPNQWLQNKEIGARRWGFEGEEVLDSGILDLSSINKRRVFTRKNGRKFLN